MQSGRSEIAHTQHCLGAAAKERSSFTAALLRGQQRTLEESVAPLEESVANLTRDMLRRIARGPRA
jgi:hypothetical protein